MEVYVCLTPVKGSVEMRFLAAFTRVDDAYDFKQAQPEPSDILINHVKF